MEPTSVAASLLLFAGKIQRGKRLRNAKVSVITSRHEYQSYSHLYKCACIGGVSMGSGSLAKIWHNSVDGAVAKFALSIIYWVVHLKQNWKTKLCTGENLCKQV